MADSEKKVAENAKTANVKTANVKTANVKTANVKTANVKTAEIKSDAKADKPVKAEKSEKTDKPAKPEKKNKVKFTEKVGKFWRDYKSEFKKIVWPSKEETIRSTVVVIISIVACGLVMAVLDFGFSKGLTLLSNVL